MGANLWGTENPVWAGEDVGYAAVHNRARRRLPSVCEKADATCKGRLEVALRRDAPEEGLRSEEGRGAYYVGDSVDGYRRLCMSHHRRSEGLCRACGGELDMKETT